VPSIGSSWRSAHRAGQPKRGGLLVVGQVQHRRGPTAVEATVVGSGTPGPDGLRVVDVLVDAVDGPDVVTRAAAGRLAIVVVVGD
jgi:hypothetical protein